MKPKLLLLALSFAILGSAVGLNRQDSPKAEQSFRNITSFKGANASDVIPAMHFMSSSLGVGCDFCHTEDRASDEKRPKNTAREMIAMQRDINARNFGGRMRVTCATCHGGHQQPIPVPPVVGIMDRARRSSDVVPDKVLAAYATAVGGDSMHPLDQLRLSGTSTTKGEKAKVDAAYMGGKFAYVSHVAQGDMKFGFDGNVVWFSTPKGTQQIPLVYAVSRVNEKLLMAGPGTLPKLDSPTGATANVGGHDQLVVNGTLADKSRASLFFDKATGLLSRVSYTYPTILGNMVQINDYADYRKVNGVMVPMTVTNHDSDGDTVYQFRSIHVDKELTAAEFAPPK